MTAVQSPDLGSAARLVSITVADDPSAWASAGFTVVDDAVQIAGTRIVLTGRVDDRSLRGIRNWTVAGLSAPAGDGQIDGLATSFVDVTSLDDTSTAGTSTAGTSTVQDTASTAVHANGTAGIDHVVVITPDLDRTIAAFAEVGLGVRRIRETESYGAPMRQAFLRLGPVIVEVVGGHEGSGQRAEEAPADWFGLALDVGDLGATATLLGDGLGGIKDAVQDGRRIATIRHKNFGMSVATALMDDLASVDGA
ncbi:MAG: VOC family protein [Acidimicrobiales bacterium]|nr:VOC family protein [Acidimicrobiales bacterium]